VAEPKILLTRIDNRLVHGQVGMSWVGAIHPNLIVVADDEAANDKVQQSLMQMTAEVAGVGAISKIRENANAITKAAGILGVMVVGGLIPTYIKFAFSSELKIWSVVSVQGIFDSILPNLLPLGFVFLLYYLLKKKNMNVIALIITIIVCSVGLSFFKLM